METRGLSPWVLALVGSLCAAGVSADGPSVSVRIQEPPPLPTDPTLEVAQERILGEFEEGTVGPSPGAPTVGLAKAVRLAVAHNFSVLSAVDSVQGAKLREGASRAGFYPQVTPHYEHSPSDQALGIDLLQRLPWSGATLSATGAFMSIPGAEAPFGKSSDVHLVLSQPLLRGFGPNATYYDLRNSVRTRVGQERTLELLRQRLAVDVATAYYQVVKERQLLGVAAKSLKRSQNLKEASEARMQVGLASKLDVFRAELQSAQAQEAMVSAQSALETALEQFRMLLGLGPSDLVEPEALSLPETITDAQEPISVLVSQAFQNRLELKETRDQVKDGERALSLAKQSLLPELDLNLDMSQIGFGNTYHDSLRNADRRVSLYLSTSYPLEHSSDKANAAIAAMDASARERTLTQREMEIEAEVRTAVRNIERIKKSVELQKKGVDFASQQHRLATLRYQRGLASNFDVVDAEGSLVSARTALVGLLTDYQVAVVQLKRVTGTLDPDKEF